jgi:hypothetical protein
VAASESAAIAAAAAADLRSFMVNILCFDWR